MQTKFITVILAFFISIQVFGQKTDLQKLNLNGAVKSIRETSYPAREVKGEVQMGDMEYYYINSFDKRGNKTEDIQFKPDGSQMKKYVYQYDTTGKRTVRLQYDSASNLVRKITYTYNAEGYCTEDNSYNPENRLEKKYTYTYDRKGNCLEDKSFNPENVLLKKVTYLYDSDGKLIGQNWYNGKGDLEKECTYHYDFQGNVIDEEVNLTVGGNPVYNYHYVYDKNGNWVKKVTMKDQRPVVILERIVKYY